MVTRVLPVRDTNGDPYPLAGQGSRIDTDLRVSATATATAVLDQPATTTATIAATIAAGATVATGVAAISSTTATITAAVSITAPTDISSLLIAGSGSFGTGNLAVPGYDQAYYVNTSSANFDNPTNAALTTGVQVDLPTPSTPNAAHSLTITYAISGRNRRMFHDLHADNWRLDGYIVEAASTMGSTTMLTYAWDTIAHAWYVAATSGDAPTTRTHAPSESPSGAVPLYFTPEARASGSFSAIQAAHVSALSALPSALSSYLAGADVVVDITSGTGDHLFETMASRMWMNPATNSGASGVFTGKTVNAYPWLLASGCCDGRTMLHEIGHAVDYHAMRYIGARYGVNPVPPLSPNENDVVYIYWPDGITLKSETHYEGSILWWTLYDESGVAYWGGYSDARASWPMFSAEAPIVDLYATVPDKPGSYYRSTISEWTAQCFMLAWADHVPGYSSSGRDALIAEVGGSAIFADFVDYAVSIGVLPSSW